MTIRVQNYTYIPAFYFVQRKHNEKKYIKECNELGRLAGFPRINLFLILYHLEICLKLPKGMEMQKLQKTLNIRASVIQFSMTGWA